MKNKKEQIEEMAKCMGEKNFLCADDCENCIQIPCKCKLVKQSKLLYKAGYRKAREVIEDFVKKLIDFPHWLENGTVLVIHMEELLELAAEIRQEVNNG